MRASTQRPFPKALAAALAHFGHPDVVGTQLITTRSGGWAVAATIRRGAKLPISELEMLSGKVPIRYEREPARIAEARPAYPALGE